MVTFQIDKEKAKSSQKEVENFVRWLENERTLGLTQLFSRFDKLDACHGWHTSDFAEPWMFQSFPRKRRATSRERWFFPFAEIRSLLGIFLRVGVGRLRCSSSS